MQWPPLGPIWWHFWGPYLGWNMTFWASVVVWFMQWRYASSLNQTKSTKICQDSHTTQSLINTQHNILCYGLPWGPYLGWNMTFWVPVVVDLCNGDMHQSWIRLNQPKYVKIVILHCLQLIHCLISCVMASPGAHIQKYDILGTGGSLVHAMEIYFQLESD